MKKNFIKKIGVLLLICFMSLTSFMKVNGLAKIVLKDVSGDPILFQVCYYDPSAYCKTIIIYVPDPWIMDGSSVACAGYCNGAISQNVTPFSAYSYRVSDDTSYFSFTTGQWIGEWSGSIPWSDFSAPDDGSVYVGFNVTNSGSSWLGAGNTYEESAYIWTNSGGTPLGSAAPAVDISSTNNTIILANVEDAGHNYYEIYASTDDVSYYNIQCQMVTSSGVPIGDPTTEYTSSADLNTTEVFAQFESFNTSTDNVQLTVCTNSHTTISLPISEDANSSCATVSFTAEEGDGPEGTAGINATNPKDLKIAVYPIPARDMLTFSFKNVDIKANPVSIISIITSYGQIVKEVTVTDYSNVQLNVNDLASGNYFYNIISGNAVLQRNAFVKL